MDPQLPPYPFQNPEPDRPRGNANCPQCKGFSAGHYKPPVAVDVTDPSIIRTLAKPPSALLEDAFNRLKGRPVTDEFLKFADKQVLLPKSEVDFWVQHLKTVMDKRQHGAVKAAATRKAKWQVQRSHSGDERTQQPNSAGEISQCFWGSCGMEYVDETDEPEVWVGCDLCEQWYHLSCDNLGEEPKSDQYICRKCCQ